MARCVVIGAAVTYLLAVVQTTLGGRVAIHGVAPDLLFLWTICLGLLSGRAVGAAVGFGCGLLEGSLLQIWIGAFATSKALSGFCAGVLATKLFRDHWAVPSVCGVLLTLVNEAAFLFIARSGDWRQVGQGVGLRMIYHAALAPIVAFLVVRGRRALVGRREEVA